MADSKHTQIPDYLRAHTVRLCENLARVDSLIDLYSYLTGLLTRHSEIPQEHKSRTDDQPPEINDVLRSAVVLLHASLEDFLRTIALAHLPRRESEILKQIPLAGTGSLNKTKFTLSDLTNHSGKNIDEVINESIDGWLHQQSFNNCGDITALLKYLGIDPSKCNGDYRSLDEMVGRRHRIVHNADRCNAAVSDACELGGISADEVTEWRNAVQQFMVSALHALHLVIDGDSEETKQTD